MLKHYINVLDNIYYIEKDGVIIFSIELNKEHNEVEIRAINNTFNGSFEQLFLSKVVENNRN